jgi:hypothetical protein
MPLEAPVIRTSLAIGMKNRGQNVSILTKVKRSAARKTKKTCHRDGVFNKILKFSTA